MEGADLAARKQAIIAQLMKLDEEGLSRWEQLFSALLEDASECTEPQDVEETNIAIERGEHQPHKALLPVLHN